MQTPQGRQVAWRLLDASKALHTELFHSTATVQAANAALRDFGVRFLLMPMLEHCPDLFLQMKTENERDADGHATNTN